MSQVPSATLGLIPKSAALGHYTHHIVIGISEEILPAMGGDAALGVEHWKGP